MPGSPILFFLLALIAVVTAIGTILSRSAIYAALLLVLNFATIAVMYLSLDAPFIALSQITVYAGSIMVLFLFVIMLLGVERLQPSEALRWQPWIAIPLGLILAAEFVYQVYRNIAPAVALPAGFGAPRSIGILLFTQYQLPFLITAVILLVAVLGAIILAKPDQPSPGEMARLRRNSAANPTAANMVGDHAEDLRRPD